MLGYHLTIIIIKFVALWLGWRCVEANHAVMFIKNNCPDAFTPWENFDDGKEKAFVRSLASILDIEGL